MMGPVRVLLGLSPLLLVGGLLAASTTNVVAAPGKSTETIRIRDDCDPTTFTANHVSCVGKGDTTFAKFLAEVTKKHKAEAWRFEPSKLEVRQGTSLQAVNVGGETHSFTKVAHFGGGFVAEPLNRLSGNPVPAPECADPHATPNAQGLLPPAGPALASLVPAGGKFTAAAPAAGQTALYQCCIHPWMRAVITGQRADAKGD